MIKPLSERLHCWKFILFWVALFLFFFVFFGVIHTVQVFDADDWTYLSLARDALPDAHTWNPTRILPEILMPTVGFIAAYFVAPVLGDYLIAITATYAFTIALFVVMYLFIFFQMLKGTTLLRNEQALVMTLLFSIMHFWIFRSKTDHNIHLFLAVNLTSYFYYIIPVLLNAMLIMVFEANPTYWKTCTPLTRGILFLLIYLAVYSNMFCSIVIVAYSGIILLREVIWKAICHKNFREIGTNIKNNGIYVGIIGIWLISMVFELKGGRADSVGTAGAFADIYYAAVTLYNSLMQTNHYFLQFVVLVYITAFGLAAYYSIKYKKVDQATAHFLKQQFCFWGAAIIVTIFLILLCGVTSLHGYISCAQVLVSILFFVLTATVYAAIYIINKLPWTDSIWPILLCIAVFNCHTVGKTYTSPIKFSGSNEAAQMITHDIIEQIYDADKNGLSEIDIVVPVFVGSEDNWPLSHYYGERVSQTLHEHGQINSKITVTIHPDPSLNEKYGMK